MFWASLCTSVVAYGVFVVVHCLCTGRTHLFQHSVHCMPAKVAAANLAVVCGLVSHMVLTVVDGTGNVPDIMQTWCR